MGKTKKNLLILLTSLLIFIEFFGLVLLPNSVKAQAQVNVVNTPLNPVNTQNKPLELKQTWQAQATSVVLGAVMQGASYFFRKLAYDTAMYVASGDKGQGALLFEKGVMAYLEYTALDAMSEAISELGKPFGLNLCTPPDLNFQAYLQIGLTTLYSAGGPKPECSWQQLKGSWGNIEEQYLGENGQLTTERMFSNALRFENTDFGIAVGGMERVDRIISKQVAGALADRMEGEGFQAATDLISGHIKTPAQVIKEESYQVTNKHQSTLTAMQLAGIYGSDGLLQLGQQVAGVFLNTLAVEGIKRLQENLGCWLGGECGGGGGGEDAASVMSFEAAGFQSSLKKAQEVFASFLAVKIVQLENYDLLTQFTTCPDPMSALPGLNNCVMDDSLRQAVMRAETGEPMTIRDALKEGLLHGDWILASPRRVADNTSYDCHKKAYCYSNIQKLRRSRILPLGFEIAALLADPDHPDVAWTLQQVVDGFDKCDYNANGEVQPDPIKFPYCHLIDPNWILKAPASRCNAQVYSSNLTDQTSGQRAQECIDIQTRIKETAVARQSQTSDFYGYCAREKKIWRLPGEACESYYNTCSTYSAKNGTLASYLAKTVDYGECSLDNVGCTAYSTEKDGDKWVASINAENVDYKIYGRNQALYFNDRIKNSSCSAGDNGCSAFYLGVLKEGTTDEYGYGSETFIKKAPDYLGCYDINKNTAAINWPQTKPELGQVSQDEKCKAFAQVCLPEEVGCDSYIPTLNPLATPVPGIVGEENSCDKSCIGYDTFKQSETNFAPSEFPLYFIPLAGDSCPGDYVGCDEFTNIDELAKGGEGLEYYYDIKYCELPTEANQKVFYSWYGSMSEGYVLKLHQLRPITSEDSVYLNSSGLDLVNETVDEFFPIGSPAYASDNPSELNELYAACNAVGYNNLINGLPGAAKDDCRALYDKDGKVYYRLLADTISVSEECHPLRKTTAYFYDDAALDEQGTCEERGGYWNTGLNPSKCQRCTNGGIYKDGACVYWAIAKPGESDSCQGPANNKGKYNGCREYVGNEGNNPKTIFNLDFEPKSVDNDLAKAKAGWNGETQVVSESVQVGLHSLQVTATNVNYVIASSTLVKDGWYKLSFWARGKVQKLDVSFNQKINFQDQPAGSFTSADYKVSIGDDWKEYKLGPIQFIGVAGKDTSLVFYGAAVSGPVKYFIDNLELRYLPGTHPIIKDSWKTIEHPGGGAAVSVDAPLVCDENPFDPYPGDALGCREYSEESTVKKVAITGFEKLCRTDAVGCRAVFDTYNTEEKEMTAYNVWCKKALPSDTSCQLKFGNKELGKCDIEQGKDGCYVDKIEVPDGAAVQGAVSNAEVVTSTIFIPADTPVTAPMFLTVHPKFSCLSNAQGCQEIGLEDQILPDKNSSASYQHIGTYLINNPAKYTGAEGTLCRDDLVGCNEFKSGSDIFYFKDPIKTGNSFCEYKTEADIGGVKFSGWFLKDIGQCYDDTTGNSMDQICQSDKDCGETGTCNTKIPVPCYKNYLQAGGEYDIWSNETKNYDGKVGVCPSEKNGCRELVDPADISQIHPDGEPYYTIFDNRVTGKVGECEGKVSQVEGCVLFNKTDEPNLLYDSAATYKESEKQQFKLVEKVTNTDNKDSNWLLKVIRDRECAEWLACQGSLPVPSSQTPTGERWSCYALQPCAEGSNLKCTTPSTLSAEIDGELTYDKYVSRETSWSGSREFSGYSLFSQLPITDLEYITVEKTSTNGLDSDAIFVGYVNREKTTEFDAASNCKVGDGKKCGGDGICYDKKCIVSPDDSYPNEWFPLVQSQAVIDEAKNEFYKYLYKSDCRGYPEQDSPFKGKLENIDPLVSSAYNSANFCAVGADGKIENCDCNYYKVEYGAGGSAEATKYYKIGGALNPALQSGGICQNEPYKDKACSSDKDCVDPKDENSVGTCIRQQRRNTNIGWNGYCLERDLSRNINGRVDDAPDAFACLTWLPLDYVPGLFDIYYSDPSVGYVPPSGKGSPGQAYCTEMLGVGGLSPDLDFKCNYSSGSSNSCTDNDDYYYFQGAQEFAFSLVQSRTWDFLNTMTGSIFGLTAGSFSPSKTYNYISRVDGLGLITDNTGGYINNAQTPQEDAFLQGQNQKGFLLEDGKGFMLEDLMVNNAIMYEGVMKTGGYIEENKSAEVPYAPLFILGNSPWLDQLKTAGVLIKKADYDSEKTNMDEFDLIVESEPVGSLDSGVLRHRQNKMETFLTKDMIYAVSFVPLWLSEYSKSESLPAMGKPMTIYMDKEYPAIGGTETDIDMKKDAFNSKCAFCKYWVSKTNYTSDGFNNNFDPVESYLLQWFANDPVNPDGSFGDGNFVDVFNASGSYLVHPFSAGCKNKSFSEDFGSGGGNHFIAVEVLFDKESGKFVGYRSRNCTEKGDSKVGYAMAVIFTLRPMCVEAVRVYDNEMKNKAYTDRIWVGGEEIKSNTYESNFVDKTADADPFGSVRFNANLENCSGDNPWCYLQRNPTNDIYHGGTPWQCVSKFKSEVGVEFKGSCPLEEGWQGIYMGYNRTQEVKGNTQIFLDSDKLNKDLLAYSNSQKYLLFDSLFATLYGKSSRLGGEPYQKSTDSSADFVLKEQDNKLHKITGDKTYDYSYVSTNSSGSIWPSLKSVGVLPYPTLNYSWKFSTDPTDFSTSIKSNNKPVVLLGDHAAFRGVPPRIYPAVDCAGTGCELDKTKEGFSVNGISTNDVKPDDKLFGIKTKMAQVKFFAWADHNQMPLRRIMVDWREKGASAPNNTISGVSEGYYTNYKPYCGDDSGKAKECVGKTTILIDKEIEVGMESFDGGSTYNSSCQTDTKCKTFVLTATCVASNCVVKKLANGDDSYSGITCKNNTECPTATPTCSDVGPKFGNQIGKTKTCKDSPVIRIFNYTCDAADAVSISTLAGTYPDNSLGQKWYNFLVDDKGLNKDSKVCVFQPRVQVLDNWGWCTGECVREYSGLVPKASATMYDGCYKDFSYTSTDLTKITDQCAPDKNLAGLYQWKDFDNIIVVAPGK